MSCDPYKWTCARCGKTHCNPEKCRDEIDYSNVREEQK